MGRVHDDDVRLRDLGHHPAPRDRHLPRPLAAPDQRVPFELSPLVLDLLLRHLEAARVLELLIEVVREREDEREDEELEDEPGDERAREEGDLARAVSGEREDGGDLGRDARPDDPHHESELQHGP